MEPKVTIGRNLAIYQGVMRFLSSFVFIALVAISGAACSSSPTAPSEPVALTLAPGQSRVVGDLSVRFIGVTNDNRCPANALCISSGEAFVALEVGLSSEHHAFELQINDSSFRSRIIGAYRIELTNVAPYPFSTDPIAPDEYRVSLTVSAR